MLQHMLFYFVFLSQVLMISLYFPSKLLSRARYVVETYPPSEYPKLYAVPVDVVEKALRSYRSMNRFALMAGLVLLLMGMYWPVEELLSWNGGSVLLIYTLVQYAPLMIAIHAGFPYYSQKRKPDTRTTRKTELRPRRLFDFVSSAVVGVAVVSYVAFVLLIVYVRQFDFPWFGGYWNIAIMTVMNLVFAGQIYRLLYGKRHDPYQAYQDRDRQIEHEVRILVATSIAATAFIGLNVGLHAFDLGDLIPISLSLYIQLLAVIGLRAFRIDETNFEVYREERLAT